MHLKNMLADWLPKVRSMAISLPLAMLSAFVLVGINETGYNQSQSALGQINEGVTTRMMVSTILRHMLDAETGQRGYLLTGTDVYLEPYEKSVSEIQSGMEQLRHQFSDQPKQMESFIGLSDAVARKLSEMDLSVRLRRQGNEDAWKFILYTDVGNEQMEAIRRHAENFISISDQKVTQGRYQIERSLALSRIGIALVTLIGLLAFYLYLRQAHTLKSFNDREQAALSRERDRLEDLVKKRTTSLSELANHLQEIREEERGHLARELHDELGALLTAAKLDVARLKSKIDASVPDVAERLKHLTDTLNSGIALKRRIIEDLRPSSLSNLGLTAAIEILTREYSERSGISVETVLETVSISENAQLTIYRIVQESLTNIGKYASANKVLVSVKSYPTHVLVEVQDDGCGFDTELVSTRSYGIAGMRHRVEAAGGRLIISSEPGNGTLVSAKLPGK